MSSLGYLGQINVHFSVDFTCIFIDTLGLFEGLADR